MDVIGGKQVNIRETILSLVSLITDLLANETLGSRLDADRPQSVPVMTMFVMMVMFVR